MSLATLKTKVEQLIDYTELAKTFYEKGSNYIKTIPPMDYTKKASLQNLFQNYGELETIEGSINCNSQTNISNMCHGCKKLKSVRLDNTEKVENFYNAFRYCQALTDISILDFSSCANAGQCFQVCGLLANVEIVPQTIKVSISFGDSPLLTVESKQSVFDGLATVTTAQTLTLNANAKILQSQVDTANAKGWTVAGGIIVSEEVYYG